MDQAVQKEKSKSNKKNAKYGDIPTTASGLGSFVTNVLIKLFKYIYKLLEIKKTTYFHFFALKTDNSL